MAKKAKKKVAARSAAKSAAKKIVRRSAKKPAAKPAPARRTTARRAAPVAAKGGSALMSVSPGITANDAAASIKWYCDVLGFTVKERWEHEGQFLGAQIASGAVTMNIGQDDWKMGRERIKGQGTRTYVMTGPAIDQYATAIKARGGRLDHDPQDGWGMRTFSITDPDGFKLTFMTMLKK